MVSQRIVVVVSGGIAAYKTVELVRELGRRGNDVRVVMTQSATRFVGPITFAGITGKPAVTDLWDPSFPGEVHVELGGWADAIVVAPATMNTLSRAAHGFADDVALATLACSSCPVLFAPAMHPRMWKQSATQRAVELLTENGAHFVGPVVGPLASGEEGMGRMAEPVQIADALNDMRRADLQGLSFLITAGPTYEDIDPVRYLGNRSSGKMGYALAREAARRGAHVVLVSGPVSLPRPVGVDIVSVRSALEMRDAVLARATQANVVIMAAAVADYRPATKWGEKLKRQMETLSLELVQNPDILAELGATRSGDRPMLIGFALETENVIDGARKKRLSKNADWIIANEANTALEGDSTHLTLVSEAGAEPLPPASKAHLAAVLVDRIRDAVASMASKTF